MHRLWQALFVVALAGLAWHLMQAVHELGHVAAAMIAGRTVEQVVLHPLAISRTQIAGGTTLAIAACGPVVGVLFPLATWAVARAVSLPGAWLAQFFAAFCLVANGAYIAADSLMEGGDGKDLVAAGAPVWMLVALGLAALALGLALLGGIGKQLGFGDEPDEISPPAALGTLAAWAALAGVLAIAS